MILHISVDMSLTPKSPKLHIGHLFSRAQLFTIHSERLETFSCPLKIIYRMINLKTLTKPVHLSQLAVKHKHGTKSYKFRPSDCTAVIRLRTPQQRHHKYSISCSSWFHKLVFKATAFT